MHFEERRRQVIAGLDGCGRDLRDRRKIDVVRPERTVQILKAPCPHNVGRASRAFCVACFVDRVCLAHSVDFLAFDVSTQIRWFSLLPKSIFRHSGMEHGVRGSAVACRRLRFACVCLLCGGFAPL